MKNVLVTGGAGFIGSNFIRYLLRSDPAVRIFNLDALTYAGSLENLAELPGADRHTFIHGDICDAALVAEILRTHAVDTIVHFAAESHVDRSILGPAPFIQTNIVGTFNLLETARQVWQVEGQDRRQTTHFHHVSTDEVFGSLDADAPAFCETTSYDPRSPYSASKASSDHLVRAYFHTYGLPVTLTNCSNNYGPWQFPEKLVPLIILNARQGKPLPVYGDGRQVRDWLFVEDHCEAIHLVISRGTLGGTYNIGGGNQPSNLEVIERICALLDEEFDAPAAPHARLVKHVPDRPGHDRRYAMDAGKIRAELGWSPRHDLGSGLRETVAWYVDHPGWVKSLLEQNDYRAWMDKNYRGREAGK